MTGTSKPKLIGRILKWTGYATAFISFAMGIREVVSLLNDRAERRANVRQLVTVARQQADGGDYEASWRSIAAATELDPSCRPIEAELGMQWLRNARISSQHDGQSYAGLTEKILPTLYASLDTARPKEAATLLAHIGWAGYLRFKEGDQEAVVDPHFVHALALDSTNLYAHAMRGFWVLYAGTDLQAEDDAQGEFDAALRHGGDTSYVRHLMIYANLNAGSTAACARIMKIASVMRQKGETLEMPLCSRILSEAYYVHAREIQPAVGKYLSAAEHLATFKYLAEGIAIGNQPYLQRTLTQLESAARRSGGR